MTETRLKFQAAFDVFYRVITGMSTSEIDGISRSAAMKLLDGVHKEIINGLDVRDAERRRDEECAIIKAYREGRLVEVRADALTQENESAET